MRADNDKRITAHPLVLSGFFPDFDSSSMASTGSRCVCLSLAPATVSVFFMLVIWNQHSPGYVTSYDIGASRHMTLVRHVIWHWCVTAETSSTSVSICWLSKTCWVFFSCAACSWVWMSTRLLWHVLIHSLRISTRKMSQDWWTERWETR